MSQDTRPFVFSFVSVNGSRKMLGTREVSRGQLDEKLALVEAWLTERPKARCATLYGPGMHPLHPERPRLPIPICFRKLEYPRTSYSEEGGELQKVNTGCSTDYLVFTRGELSSRVPPPPQGVTPSPVPGPVTTG